MCVRGCACASGRGAIADPGASGRGAIADPGAMGTSSGSGREAIADPAAIGTPCASGTGAIHLPRGATSFEALTTVETTEGYTPLPKAVSLWR